MHKNYNAIANVLASIIVGCLTIFFVINSNATVTQVNNIDLEIKEVNELLDSWTGQSEILEQANEKLSNVLKQSPRNYLALYQLARYKLKSGYISQIAGRYKSYNFSVGNYSPGTLNAAESTIRSAIKINPRFADGYVLLAQIQFDETQLDKVEKSLKKAEAIGTKNPWLQLQWAALNVAKGEYSAAEMRNQSVLDSDIKDNKAKSASLYNLIDSSKRKGEYDHVIILYKEYFKLNPTNAWAHGDLASFLNGTLGRNDEAITQAREALKIMDYGIGEQILAMALYGKWADLINEGKLKEATVYFNEAWKIYPKIYNVMAWGASKPAGEKLAKALIEKKKIPINVIDDLSGSTALLLATNQNNVDAVKFLLKLGANPNVFDNSGWTPLLSAADEGNSEIVDILLANKADIKQTANGIDAATLAKNKGNKKLYEKLKKIV
jgi:hypothetical protein